MSKDDLISITLSSGVNEKGEGFVTIVAMSEDHNMFIGQLPPDAVRALGLNCFESAEAAETDSCLFRLLQAQFGLSLEATAAFIGSLRAEREERLDE